MKPIITPALLFCFCFFWILPKTEATSIEENILSLACNDTVLVSVDYNCEALILFDHLLESPTGQASDYSIQLQLGPNSVPNPVPSTYLGESLIATITEIESGNSCWSTIITEDKLGPVFDCPADTISIDCWQEISSIPAPIAIDNCSLADISLSTSQLDDDNICDDRSILTLRIWTAFDEAGNQSFPGCKQYIRQVRPNDVDFPNDIIWSCNQYNSYPNILDTANLIPEVLTLQNGINTIDASQLGELQALLQGGSGNPGEIDAAACKFDINYSEEIIDQCGTSFDIIRTWVIYDWCESTIITTNLAGEDGTQIIKVMDITPPEILGETILPVPVDSTTACFSQAPLPILEVLEDCNDFELRIFTPAGEAAYVNGINAAEGASIPMPGLAPGVHEIIYLATNTCGQISELAVNITIFDPIAPVSLCDEITEINLNADGAAIAFADVFDDGSYDNCCLDLFQVKRMTASCDPSDLEFGPYVSFCCADEVNSPIQVAFRATDCYNNYNECLVQVYVNDKLPPTVDECPAAVEITCHEWEGQLESALNQGDFSVLDQYGVATITDNCVVNMDYLVGFQVNVCGYGQIARTWTGTDESGNTPASCNQIISVVHVSEWGVSFPEDLVALCTDSDLPDFGEPVIFLEDCELIGISFEDQLFNIVPDACYKIIRTWAVINWCVFETNGADIWQEYDEIEAGTDFDGDDDLDDHTFFDGINNGDEIDGYIVFEQVIKVVDEEAPGLTIEDQNYCIIETDCFMDINLPGPTITDCSSEFEVLYTTDMPNDQGNGVFQDVPVGEFEVLYEVWDECGNLSVINQNVIVEDCKLPTPVCFPVLTFVIMQNGMLELSAEVFNAGSYDNCDGPLYYSFSSTVSDSLLWLDCDDLGQVNVEIWVTDQSGNQDFCETYFFLYDNVGNACAVLPIMAGLVYAANDEAMEETDIFVNSEAIGISDIDGYYAMELPYGGDYTIHPFYDDDPLNGVSTFDQVLISLHILGITPIENPYFHIAADANGSGSVTTSDIVELRKLILGLSDSFPNLESWRFIDAAYQFPNPLDPWQEPFPETLNYNNLIDDVLDADFIGVKVGDVNGSVVL